MMNEEASAELPISYQKVMMKYDEEFDLLLETLLTLLMRRDAECNEIRRANNQSKKFRPRQRLLQKKHKQLLKNQTSDNQYSLRKQLIINTKATKYGEDQEHEKN